MFFGQQGCNVSWSWSLQQKSAVDSSLADQPNFEDKNFGGDQNFGSFSAFVDPTGPIVSDKDFQSEFKIEKKVVARSLMVQPQRILLEHCNGMLNTSAWAKLNIKRLFWHNVDFNWGKYLCGQSYKHFMTVNYDPRVVPDWKIPHITTLEL